LSRSERTPCGVKLLNAVFMFNIKRKVIFSSECGNAKRENCVIIRVSAHADYEICTL